MSRKLCLQWSDFKENIANTFGILRKENDFADVTLVSEDGDQVESHKLVLSSSSRVFEKMLKGNKHSHPLIYMNGLKSEDLFAILDFLYYGETNVSQENLDSFLAIAEGLQISGLAAPEIDIPIICKKENNVSKSEATPKPLNMDNFEHSREISSFSVPLSNNTSFSDIQKLDEQIDAIMVKTSRKTKRGMTLYACNVCGKEDNKSHTKDHIEANHLQGVSIPCNFCDKIFKSRHAKTNHIRTHHKDMK